jgi:hypothetical protein
MICYPQRGRCLIKKLHFHCHSLRT